MKSDRHSELISLLEQINRFLADKFKLEPAYGELTKTLKLLAQGLEPNSKPIIKIVSPSKILATELQRQNQANESLRSLYQFEVVSPISQIHKILRRCDLICLLYDSTQKIRPHHQKLIELAQSAEITVFLLVHQGKSQSDNYKDSYKDWLTAQDYSVSNVELSLNNFINLDNPSQESYWRSLTDALPTILNSCPIRIRQAVKKEIEQFFRQEIAGGWREINQIKTQYLQDKELFAYRQQFRQDINNHNQFRQQIIREIKQGIHHAKADLINPFSQDGLMFELQQLIDSAEVKTIKKLEQVYLYLILEDMSDAPLFHDYVWNLCQQKAAKTLKQEWSKIVQVYGSGGLQSLSSRTNQDLDDIAALLDNTKFVSAIFPSPALDLTAIVDAHVLEFNSRIIFDYSYLQSSWFRLSISVSIGLGIYLFTLLLFGEGRYFGFLIIIFQIINLITGQNVKKAKLKQHKKELKRLVYQRYQSLIRIIFDRVIKTLIQATDSYAQQGKEQWEEAIAIAQNKLDELKQTSDRHKKRIDTLKQTQSIIQSWLD